MTEVILSAPAVEKPFGLTQALRGATMTLDLYGHLFPDQLDEVADRLDAAARCSVPVAPGPTSSRLVG